jgi:hypothetical protein
LKIENKRLKKFKGIHTTRQSYFGHRVHKENTMYTGDYFVDFLIFGFLYILHALCVLNMSSIMGGTKQMTYLKLELCKNNN